MNGMGMGHMDTILPIFSFTSVDIREDRKEKEDATGHILGNGTKLFSLISLYKKGGNKQEGIPAPPPKQKSLHFAKRNLWIRPKEVLHPDSIIITFPAIRQ